MRLWLALSLIFTVGCGGGGGGQTNSGGSAIRPEGSEQPYNGTPISYSGDTLTFVATAQFRKFNDYDLSAETGSGTQTDPIKNGLTSTSVRPIRRAEFHVKNASGSIIQAGETGSSGQVSFVIPKAPGTYSLQVNSRAFNAHVKASVLNNPYDKVFYSISTLFTVSGSESGTQSLTLPTAPHDSTLEGGAFNILDLILEANDYIRANANPSASSSQANYCPSNLCHTTFTVADKVGVYWTKGLSPGTYFGSPQSAISFFVPNSSDSIYQGLYILGGIEDDTCQDTDHFDASVVLHEYGHFLESIFAGSDSPGGSHDGNSVIDPRLAWSEGWANFFQSAVLGRSVYRDTAGNSSCPATQDASWPRRWRTARLNFTDFNMKEASGRDVPARSGEGNFREMSIARSLYGVLHGPRQTANDPGSAFADLGFAVIWESFLNLNATDVYFRSHGHFNANLNSLLAANSTLTSSMSSGAKWDSSDQNDLTAVLVRERQQKDRRDYAHLLSPQSVAAGSCAGAPSWYPYTFTEGAPVRDQSDGTGSIVFSDPFNTNDFFLFYHNGSSQSITLRYQRRLGYSGTRPFPWDLDLYLYQTGYVHLNNADILRRSEGTYPEQSSTGFESINLAGLPAGYYLINIKVDYGPNASARADTTYSLELSSGVQLCP